MTDTLPSIRFGRFEGQLAAITEDTNYSSMSALTIAFPNLASPENIHILAQALNHFDPKGQSYTLISAPVDFATDYKARYEASDETPMDPNNPEISDFALPDLAQITAPKLESGEITFYATINGLGVPYKVSGPSDGSDELTYAPL